MCSEFSECDGSSVSSTTTKDKKLEDEEDTKRLFGMDSEELKLTKKGFEAWVKEKI